MKKWIWDLNPGPLLAKPTIFPGNRLLPASGNPSIERGHPGCYGRFQILYDGEHQGCALDPCRHGPVLKGLLPHPHITSSRHVGASLLLIWAGSCLGGDPDAHSLTAAKKLLERGKQKALEPLSLKTGSSSLCPAPGV
ncbi:uncharacterized protein LOC144281781 isoform X1 [Canis aureus]